MKTIQFKTNINCSGCVATVKPFLDHRKDIEKWAVNTASPDKILTVQTGTATTEEIIETVKKAGFHIQPLT